MATRILKIDASDLTLVGGVATRVLSSGVGTDTFFTPSPASGGGTETYFFVTNANIPNSDAWEDGGTWTVEIEVDSGNGNISGNVRTGRCDSAGNILQVGSFVGTQSMNVSRVFSPVAPTWTGGDEACGNRLFIEMLFTNDASHGAQNIDVAVGTITNEVIDDITEDAGSCGGGGANVPQKFMHYQKQRK